MNRPKTILTISLSAALIVAASFTMLGFLSPSSAIAHGGSGGWHGRHSGHGSGHGFRGGHGDPCERLTSHPLKIAELMIESHLDLSDDQVAQLQPMLTVVDEWRNDLAVQCEAGVAATDVPLALTAVEGALARSAQAVADLQGPYQSFYASLDDEQRAHIDEAVLRHRAKHGDDPQ